MDNNDSAEMSGRLCCYQQQHSKLVIGI